MRNGRRLADRVVDWSDGFIGHRLARFSELSKKNILILLNSLTLSKAGLDSRRFAIKNSGCRSFIQVNRPLECIANFVALQTNCLGFRTFG